MESWIQLPSGNLYIGFIDQDKIPEGYGCEIDFDKNIWIGFFSRGSRLASGTLIEEQGSESQVISVSKSIGLENTSFHTEKSVDFYLVSKSLKEKKRLLTVG